ncbi:putative ribonuclease t2 [Diaporthe ampelina]|uniref:Ribonuclease T2-like n=1 Tax=Diaporthe ampelina TaxID=1214573 RepID=A0A0G2HY93_9PEZI|nr:putative ribonuclease t2 [Diaporthe ampelina]
MAVLALAVLASLAASPLATADAGASMFNTRATCSGPGGQFLQTQFWDTDPDSWTIHGLWPDNCDGTYDQDCDSSRAYTNLTELIQAYGSDSLLQFMNTYWLSDSESAEAFWEHEWSKHGTCISTLEPSCYTDYQAGEEAVAFFQVVVDLFKSLDTYTVLSKAGIVPSNSATYTSSQITKAISASFGQDPVILCSGSTLYQIYYGFVTNGPLADGAFVPTAITGQSSNCPSSGVKYPLKSGAAATSSTRTATGTATSTSAAATATGTSVSGSGYWNAQYNGQADGCLISSGTWYVGGTCATYKATATSNGFTMTSSKGNCGVTNGVISCGSGVALSTFSVAGGLLAYDGQTEFYASAVPSGSTQASVYVASQTYSVTFQWQSV